MRRLVALVVMLAALPVPARAATTTFTAPYRWATTYTDDRPSGAPLREQSASISADASSGRVQLETIATSGNPNPLSGTHAIAEARFELGTALVSSGRIRVTIDVSGQASARRDTTMRTISTGVAHVGIAAIGLPGTHLVVIDDGPQLPLSSDTDTFGGTRSISETREITVGGYCPAQAVEVEIAVGISARVATSEIDAIRASAEITFDRITVEDLPCVPPPPQVDVLVSSETFSYEPSSITVPSGTEVVWTWGPGGVPHSVTADDGSFDSPTQSAGTFTHAFTTAGTYGYYCELHGAPGGEGMSGVVTVT